MKKWMENQKLRMKYKKYVAGAAAVALAAGSIGTGIWMSGASYSNGPAEEAKAQVTASQPRNVALSEGDLKNLEKDETVYVISNADGSTQKVIVSDWIKNAMESESIQDETNLTDIVNVKGEESFQQKENGLGVWDAKGNDIFYQGSIDKELPVDMKVEYSLNGETVSADELAGQSGRVTIRFSYTNNQKETVLVNGKETELYVPFVVLTGMMLDNEKFRNVEVTKGKVINDGEHLMVVGYAMPGMQENLDVDPEDLEIPDSVEITANVSDFELLTSLTVVTNEVFNDIDFDDIDSLDELSDSLDELQDAMNELMDGCDELYDGICELYDKSGELTDGIDELRDGAKDLASGAGDLKNGAGELKDGAAELNAGLKTLKGNNDTLTAGAKQVFETLLDTAESALKDAGVPNVPELTIENYGTVLEQISGTLSPEAVKALAEQTARAAVTAEVEKNRPLIEQQVEAAMKAQIRQAILEQMGLGKAADGNGAAAGSQNPAGNPAVENAAGSDTTGANTTESATAGSDPSVSTGSQSEAETGSPAGNRESSEEEADKPSVKTNGQEETSGSEDTSGSEEVPMAGESAAITGSGRFCLERAMADSRATVVANVRRTVASAAGGSGLTEEQEKQIEAAVNAQFAQMQAQYQAQVESVVQSKIEENMQSETVQAQIAAAVNSAAGGANSLKSLKASLDSYNQFYQGILAYTAGVAQASEGSQKLADGSKALYDGSVKLADGANKLKDGTGELKDGGDKLIDGILQLKDGGQELVDGVNEFNEEGIQKLVDTFDGDVQELIDRMEAVSDLSKGYKSFGGISDKMEGSVKFIYKTEAIEAENE